MTLSQDTMFEIIENVYTDLEEEARRCCDTELQGFERAEVEGEENESEENKDNDNGSKDHE